MAIAFAQQVGGAATTSGQTSFTTTAATFTAGNLLILVVEWTLNAGTSPTLTITIPSGWTDSGKGTVNNGAPSGGMACCVLPNNPGGSQTFNVSVSSTGTPTIDGWAYTIFEFSGAATSSPLDLASASANTGATSSTTWNSGAASGTTQAGDLLFGAIGLSRSTASTMTMSASSVPTSGWTAPSTWFDDTGASTPHAHVSGCYQIVSGTVVNPSAVGTLSQTNSSEGILLTIKQASTVATLPQRPIVIPPTCAVMRASLW